MLNHQSVLVIGLGKSGKEAALLLKEKGAEVTVLELEKNFSTLKKKEALQKCGIQVVFGSHQENLLKKKHFIVISPGVPYNLPIIKKAESLGIQVISELEFASLFIPAKNIIAITGSNGKTTTTFLTYKILKKSGIKALIGGNIGTPVSRLVRRFSPHLLSGKIITEVSSFQLEKTFSFSPHIYCILNLSFNHLDRHSSFFEYQKIKAAPLPRMGPDDFAILNYDQPQVSSLGRFTLARVIFFSQRQKLTEGIFVEDDRIMANIKNMPVCIPFNNLQIEKFHNLDNVLCAVGIALIEGVSPELIGESLTEYRPLPHRQQLIKEIDGVRFIDDSKATNQAAVENMLASISSPVILIMGGRDKGGDFSYLKSRIFDKVKTILLLGEAKERIREELGGALPARECKSLSEAVRVAFSLSQKGDSVVLSPGCSSLDEFTSYRHRGKVFANEVRKLKEEIEEKKSI